MLADSVAQLVEKLECELVFQVGFQACFQLLRQAFSFFKPVQQQLQVDQLQDCFVKLQSDSRSFCFFGSCLNRSQNRACVLQVAHSLNVAVALLVGI